MEWVLLIVIVLGFMDIESKLDKLIKNGSRKALNKEMIKGLVNKKVNLIVENENINNAYLFSPSSHITGVIKEYDDIWICFEYQNKKEIFHQYFRIVDITSINEIKG